MMNLEIIIGIPVALLVLLLLAWRRDITEVRRLRAGLPKNGDYVVRLPQGRLLAQCFSLVDVEFAARSSVPALLRLLVYERRRLALSWLHEARRETTRLYGWHVRAVRHAEDLRPAAELKLFSAVVAFLALQVLMVAAVWFYGPLRMRRFVLSVQSMADLLARIGERVAAGIVPRAQVAAFGEAR